ncbi:MAG TPA: hypothetical protein VMG12_38080 [Polyangiaceae bacterium]|nr:hypothetical protein [Polyangiaceae bacterium]
MTQQRPATADSAPSVSREGREGADVEQTEVRVSQRRAAAPARLDVMLAHAHRVIAGMAPADPRARLLQVAMLRRDEILLEALLKRLDAAPY